MAATGKHVHHCPPFPDGWTAKITGPSWRPGDSPEVARARWQAWLRVIAKLTPCPSQAGKGTRV